VGSELNPKMRRVGAMPTADVTAKAFGGMADALRLQAGLPFRTIEPTRTTAFGHEPEQSGRQRE
jgi:hypothetical protein